ncbi:MAG: DNA polymerase III subunit gamma/tau [Actinobacteria bacterium]|nr:DNA polymerase III subunit gamma/tau [Actinomycetota bacterium]
MESREVSSPSLYRRHRPRTFSDVVGQEAVVRTLRNAIDRNAVHHAYLFVGSRGTGKTSMAKILAAALNCANGPTTEPCGVCSACEAIAQGSSLDVVEMDAASNNSVDDIRDLRDSVALAPMSGSHKVYILDEAHMLSPAAWNAFLKTLEEPPPNTVFVLATTEAKKILPTIVDRCHRFDFQRPSVVEVQEVVTRVAATEGIDAPPEVLRIVARSADGSFRDALGTLEQLVTYAGGESGAISTEDALAVLGVVDADLRFEAIDAVVASDPAAAVRTAAKISDSGRDVRRFLDDLEGHGRSLLLADLSGSVPAELATTPEYDARLAAQADALGRAGIVTFLDLVAEAFGAIKDGADARLRLELLLVKAASRGKPMSAGKAPTPALPPQVVAAPAVAPTPPAPEAPQAVVQSAPLETSIPTGSGASAALSAVPQVDPVVEMAEAAPAPSLHTGPVPTFEEVLAVWPQVVEQMAQESPVLSAILAQATPLRLVERRVTVGFPIDADFHRRKAADQRYVQSVMQALADLTGARLELEYELSEAMETTAAAQERALSGDEMADILLNEFGGVEVSGDKPADVTESAPSDEGPSAVDGPDTDGATSGP